MLRIAGRQSPCSKQPGLGLDSAKELMCLGLRALLRKCSLRCRDGELPAWVVAASIASRELLCSMLPSSQPSPYWLLHEKAQESVEKVSVYLLFCFSCSSILSNGVMPAVALCSSVASCWPLRPKVSSAFLDGSRANVLSCSSSLCHQQPLLSLMLPVCTLRDAASITWQKLGCGCFPSVLVSSAQALLGRTKLLGGFALPLAQLCFGARACRDRG